MRSDLIFGALAHVTNRYTLCQLASKATRKLHKPNTPSARRHPPPPSPKQLRSSSAAQLKARPVAGPFRPLPLTLEPA
jgi:hypothetical protein